MGVSRCLQAGSLGAADLRRRLGVSPATLMRAVRAEGNSVLRLGRARATRYALPEAWPGFSGPTFPMFRVSEAGRAEAVGDLVTLAAGETLWHPSERVGRGLPAEVDDALPGGPLSAHFAVAHSDLRLPPERAQWSAPHILLALTRRGEDLPGNLIVGLESLARWQAIRPSLRTHADFPALADAVVAGQPVSPLLGGSRPKFGALVDGRHVLVKFAPGQGSADPVAARWRDLLYLEALAHGVIAERGVPTAELAIVEAGPYLCLEVVRFDRIGLRGRRAVMRLSALHRDPADSWTEAGASLRDAGAVSEDDARHLRWLDAFGALIAATDRHQRRVAFLTGGERIRLAPVCGLRPGLLAPSSSGQVPDRSFVVPQANPGTGDVWDDARSAAGEFWGRASDDPRLSDGVRTLAASAARQLA